jgi:hypothetical protein
MNPALIQRAIQRHRYMQDRPAYREFLEHVRDQGSTWLVPQAEIAEWWEDRQSAIVRCRYEDGTLILECDLERACVEVDGERVLSLPARIDGFPSADANLQMPAYDADLCSPFFEEVLGHLGYRHIEASPSLGEDEPLAAASIRPLMEAMLTTARKHQRLPERETGLLRGALREAHQRRGLPDFRLWTLPAEAGRPFLSAVSSRYDVDKAIVNLPQIHDLEESFGLRSTVYLRPLGMFYGGREIRGYLDRVRDHEIALHGEFVSSAEERFGNEMVAATGEKQLLQSLTGREVLGVCMHGGELRTNTTSTTRDAIEDAGYRYETMYRNQYYLPLHLPIENRVRRTLSIGQHFADISVPGTGEFPVGLANAFIEQYSLARGVGGVFVPVMHPLYFDLANYLSHPMNLWRIAAFSPRFLVRVARMKIGQNYSNVPS